VFLPAQPQHGLQLVVRLQHVDAWACRSAAVTLCLRVSRLRLGLLRAAARHCGGRLRVTLGCVCVAACQHGGRVHAGHRLDLTCVDGVRKQPLGERLALGREPHLDRAAAAVDQRRLAVDHALGSQRESAHAQHARDRAAGRTVRQDQPLYRREACTSAVAPRAPLPKIGLSARPLLSASCISSSFKNTALPSLSARYMQMRNA